MDMGYTQGANKPASFTSVISKTDYRYFEYLSKSGHWITIWDEFFRPCICEGKKLEQQSLPAR